MKPEFRAWYKGERFPLDKDDLFDSEKPQMIYNVEKLYDGIGCAENPILGGYSSFGSLIDNEDFVLMQFTGICDKNGKKVFEGDVVKVFVDTRYKSTGNGNPVIEIPMYINYEVKYVKEMYSLSIPALKFKPLTSVPSYFKTGDMSFEIIGNLYENPNLIEQ